MGDFEEIQVEQELVDKAKPKRVFKQRAKTEQELEDLSLHGKPVSLKALGFHPEAGSMTVFNHEDGKRLIVKVDGGWALTNGMLRETRFYPTLMAVDAVMNPPPPPVEKPKAEKKVVLKKSKKINTPKKGKKG